MMLNVKKITGLVKATMVALTLSAGFAQAYEKYSFGVVPQFEPRKLAEIWLPVLKELTKRTGYEFALAAAGNIPNFETSLQYGGYDFAYMNPYHVTQTTAPHQYEPLVSDGKSGLTGIVVVAKDSPITSVRQLDGIPVAFPAPNAFAATLLVRAELDGFFGIVPKAEFSSTHTSAYLRVALGKNVAAGGVRGTLAAQKPELRDRLRLIYETQEVPRHAVAAHQRVPVEVRENVRQALLEMAKTENGRGLLAKIPMLEPKAASMSDYYSVRELHMGDYLAKEIN